ncbi:sorting nexin-27-like [Anneissia japonica]|uniref:sorting nexin-27-like n=1 Tax=Anneissia japonica TaxID=1529436 RepID=UPI0014254C27|nr:sorting nexin-27-like [Anneissia japonica]
MTFVAIHPSRVIMAESNNPGSEETAKPRVVTIHKSETGFGFNVRGQVSEGGQLKSINGELYAPLQHVSAVLEGGAAEKAGILKGDRILEVNGENVEGATHKHVVDLIKQGGSSLTLTIISVPNLREDRGEPSDDSSGYSNYDYSEKRQVSVTIPDYRQDIKNGDKFVVYDIYNAGILVGSHRFSEFAALHANLKREFVDYQFPKFPSKWPFSLSEKQLDTRRRELQQYLEKVCSIRIISESEYIQDFLKSSEKKIDEIKKEAVTEVDMRVLLPNRKSIVVRIRKSSTTEDVYQMVVFQLQMSEEAANYFALYEVKEDFERKLSPTEFPHNIQVQNYSSAGSVGICLRKWVFSLQQELFLNHDAIALEFLFWQAVDDVSKERIKPGNHLSDLKKFQENDQKLQYLKVARQCKGYGELEFPHCPCDARKSGHVIPIISLDTFRLQACTEDGVIEEQVPTFKWTEIKQFEYDDEAMAFTFEYEKTGKKPRWVKVHTQYFKYMLECFSRVAKERKISEEGTNNHSENGND